MLIFLTTKNTFSHVYRCQCLLNVSNKSYWKCYTFLACTMSHMHFLTTSNFMVPNDHQSCLWMTMVPICGYGYIPPGKNNWYSTSSSLIYNRCLAIKVQSLNILQKLHCYFKDWKPSKKTSKDLNWYGLELIKTLKYMVFIYKTQENAEKWNNEHCFTSLVVKLHFRDLG